MNIKLTMNVNKIDGTRETCVRAAMYQHRLKNNSDFSFIFLSVDHELAVISA